jgi:hypothetical protein
LIFFCFLFKKSSSRMRVPTLSCILMILFTNEG